MKGKRTGLDFTNHELIIRDSEDSVVYYLKKPCTRKDSIKYINTNGIMAVTGDYGNWIFCREFYPSAKEQVSGQYWEEKLTNSSCQKPLEFDSEGTKEDINKLLEEEDDLSNEEKEYLNKLLALADDNFFDYEYFAHRENCGRFDDNEHVPKRMKRNYWLDAVFDGFDEMCRRMKEEKENIKK